MSNVLKDVRAEVRRLSVAEAEVWLHVQCAHEGPTMEVRGRLVGPRCPGTTTVEVSYPLRLVPRLPEGMSPLTRRVIIPEPSLWTEARPFVYRVLLEVWEEGQRIGIADFDCGLRLPAKEMAT